MFGELIVQLKKRIIVRRTVRSMFGEQTVRPVKNGLYVHRNHQSYQGRGALDGHLDFHTQLLGSVSRGRIRELHKARLCDCSLPTGPIVLPETREGAAVMDAN